MIAQRRGRAGSASLVPSKLSSYTLAPLTPTPENGPTTPSATGFFSSVLSAAQNATNSLSNTITSTTIATPWSNNSKRGNGKDQDDKAASGTASASAGASENGVEHDEVEVESSISLSQGSPSLAESKEPAVKTLGMGDLSLSQLGITEQPKSTGSSLSQNSSSNSALDSNVTTTAPPPAQRTRDASLDSRHRSGSAPADSAYFHASSDSFDQGSDAGGTAGGRPGSIADNSGHDDRTPPTGSLNDDKSDAVQRTASIRSAIERRRNRGSSAVSSGTIAAAIAAANASLAHPAAHGAAPKLTGFAVASKKRNRDFHSFFKSVPDDDYLIEDYSCALQREILAHGRLYVSEGHLCFSSNILGWVTTLVMSFDEIVSVEKRSTALVFKNGLMISTLHAKHIFASFASRDSTYDLIVKIWKLGHPSLQSSINGVRIDETGGDKTEKIDDGDDATAGSRSASDSEEDSDDDSNDVYDEDAEGDDIGDPTLSSEGGGAADGDVDRTLTRKASAAGTAAAATATTNGAGSDKPKDASAASGAVDFPGPATHAATDCGDAASHYDKILCDEVISAPLGKVFSYMFGAASVTFMPKWLNNDQKCFDIQITDKKGLSTENKSRTYSYIKPLNASIGPKQTKCIVTEQIEMLEFDKAIHIVCSTQNPDVPSGNIFTVKTKYCLSWGESNGTRIQMNCTTEWTGKSWLKVPIEKAANDGQAQYGRDIIAGLKEALLSRTRGPSANGAPGGGRGKGGKKGRKGKTTLASGTAGDSERHKPKQSVSSDWGLLEPVHGILGPAIDIIKPLLTGNVMYGLLVGLLVASWFGFGFNSNNGGGGGVGGVGGLRRGAPDRIAAYDEMWRREESELWDWLEERVGLDRLMDGNGLGVGAVGSEGRPGSRGSGSGSGSGLPQHSPLLRRRVVEPRTVEEKLREERMDDREVREAIRVTEEKLKVLKEVVDKKEKAGE